MKTGRPRSDGGGSPLSPDSEIRFVGGLAFNARLDRLSQRIRAEIHAMKVEQKDRAFLATGHGTNYSRQPGTLAISFVTRALP